MSRSHSVNLGHFCLYPTLLSVVTRSNSWGMAHVERFEMHAQTAYMFATYQMLALHKQTDIQRAPMQCNLSINPSGTFPVPYDLPNSDPALCSLTAEQPLSKRLISFMKFVRWVLNYAKAPTLDF